MNKHKLGGDSRLNVVERIMKKEFNGLLDLEGIVCGPEYFINNDQNTIWKKYLLHHLRHEFGLMSNSDVKYLPLVAKLAYSDEVGFDKRDDNRQEMLKLHRIIEQLKKDESLFQKSKNNPEITLSELYKPFEEKFNVIGRNDTINADNLETTDEYDVVEVKDFATAKYYTDLSCTKSKLCFGQGEDTWKQWIGRKTQNRVYVCLKKGWKDIEEKPTENAPYDEYGTSMIFVFISPEGDLLKSCTRWNHENNNGNSVDTAFTKESLAKTVGKKFSETFKPYMEEYIKNCGYVKIENVQEQLDSGKKPEEVFDGFCKIHEGFVCVQLNGKWNYVDKNGKLLSPNQWFDCCENFQEGFACVYLNGKWNFINNNGNLLSPYQWFENCCYFQEGFAIVRLNGKCNLIDKNGKILSPNLWFDCCGRFCEGFACVNLNGKWNYVDKNGKLLSNQWFEVCENFHHGFGCVELNRKWNFIDKNGKFLSPNQWFDLCLSFHEGFARVVLHGKGNLIDKNGNLQI